MNYDSVVQNIVNLLTQAGLKVLGALVIWVAGRWLIAIAHKLIRRALQTQKLDPTLIGYLQSAVGIVLNVALIVAILGFFGVETATFAALIAGAGVAIGMAWSGLLSNFAAGIFLVMLRPFKAGDFVSAAGITGTVTEIGLFATTINTPDNVKTILGNAKILGDTIQNYSANPYRRVELTAQLPHDADVPQAIALLKTEMKKMKFVAADPAPDVELLSFNLAGPLLAVRPYTHTDTYWAVYFATNDLIRETMIRAGVDVPEQHFAIRHADKA
jgi:small conductance mechanosensitive channel